MIRTFIARVRNPFAKTPVLGRLRADRSGNFLIMTGLAIVPMIFAVGFGIDYSRAMRMQTKLNAAADAAALAGVTAPMMAKNATDAETAAKAMFKAQASGLPGVVIDLEDSAQFSVAVTTSGALNNGRNVVVTYHAKSTNVFGGLLGSVFLPITGSSTSDATRAPHINFFLLMDVSPSMLLPSTTAGLDAMRTKTGCAFACHTKDPRGDGVNIKNAAGTKPIWLDSSGNPWAVNNVTSGNVWANNTSGVSVNKGAESAGQYADGWWLARNYGTLYGTPATITLRLDEEKAAAQQLIPFATKTAADNQVTYKLQIFTYDWTNPGQTSPVTKITSTMADVATMGSYTVPDFYASQDNWYKNNWPTSTLNNNDKGTEVHNSLVAMNTIMPTPGDGSTSAKAQEVLFIITDGVTDEDTGSGRRNREWSATNLADCTTIKGRGIRIAILYTKYLPESLTGEAWSQTNVAPYLPNVAGALQSCASTTQSGAPLFYEVTTDESIPQALSALFALTVQSAHLLR